MANAQKSLQRIEISPIQRLLRDFGRRRAALDYAFFKVNLPDQHVALLVDFIIRRRQGIAQVRVSAHASEGSGVYFAEYSLERLALEPSDCAVSVERCWLAATM